MTQQLSNALFIQPIIDQNAISGKSTYSNMEKIHFQKRDTNELKKM